VTAAVPGPPLVTGGAGFAGSHLVERLLTRHTSIVAWANPSGGRGSSADPRIQWMAVDVTEPSAVERAVRASNPSVIYHCAGLPHVAESWSRSEPALRVNAFGTYALLEGVRRAGLRCPVLIVGSALVYRPSPDPLTEEDPVGPSDPYGVSKLAQEMAGAHTSTPVFIARPFNHAGPRQPSAFVTSTFARQIAEIEAGAAEPVLKVGNLDARRDITDVRDTVRGYEAIIASGRAGVPYNVCSGRAYRIADLLEQLLDMSQVAVRVQQDEARMRPSDNPIVCGDPSRITSDTGWRAEIPIERTLADLLDWWRREVRARNAMS
jgi:GDP-4-dehydro-6-deoxy-D-mannose reductase